MYYTHLITKSKFRNTFLPPDGGVSVTISSYKNLAETKYSHDPRVAEYDFITNYRIQIPTFTGNLQGFFISYVVVRQIDALHRMPSQGLH